MPHRLAAVAVLLFFPTSLLWAQAARAQVAPTDSVRGRVTTDSGVAIFGATIAITVAPSAENFTTSSDSAGHYALGIPNGTGEYVLYIGALGRRPLRQRLRRTGGDTTFVIDAKLAPAVAALAPVQVQASRPRPARALVTSQMGGADATDKNVDGVTGALPPELQGNIDAMAALIPGLTIGPGGTSAFGLAADNNYSTINGVGFSGASLPREMRTNTRFITSPWDPTKGGFSGVLVSTTVTQGSNITQRRARLAVDHPVLQSSDAVTRPYGQNFGTLALNAAGEGPIRLDKYYYNVAGQLTRTVNDAASLLDADAEALAHAGISRDSAERLIQILSAQQVPLGLSVPASRRTTGGIMMARFDRQRPAGPPTAVPKPLLSGVAYAQLSSSEAFNLGPLSAPSATGKRTSGSFWLQGMHSAFFGRNGWLVNELTSALSYSDSRGRPYVPLPGASVLVASTLPDGGSGIGQLTFGGNGFLTSNASRMSWETVNQSGFLVKGRQELPVNIYLQSRFEGFQQSAPANNLGTFSYASLDDVAAGRPISFTRTLSSPSADGRQWVGAGALGGMWNKRKLRIIGGARVDANTFLTTPPYNAAVETTFGVRTDRVPNSVGVSPRLGFLWFYNNRPGNSSSATGYSQLNYSGPHLRGGIGAFRSTFSPSLISDALVSTGLDDGMRRLLCIGSEAPTPDWTAYAASAANIPAQCASGNTNFADTSRSVSLFHERYRQAMSWRAGLGWTATIRSIYLAIDAMYSINRQQPGLVDLNFVGTQQFALPLEDNRPVFVPQADIEPTTGAVSSIGSRLSPDFGRVSQRVSDLESRARQLTVYTIPNVPFRWGVYVLSYTLSDVRAESRGFDQSTGRDPRLVETSPSAFNSRHQFGFQFARSFWSKVAVTAFVRAQSGARFTPTVAGDVNGDGVGGDRAYVFDPAVEPDTAIRNGLLRVMGSGSAAARECLLGQRGTLAKRNSCTGPWFATMTTTMYVIPAIPRTSNRARISVSLSNPLSGLDQLLHGGDKLRGWGVVPFPDATLYQVRGFVPAENRFLYQVNPRFGASSPAASTLRAPFRLTLELSTTLGRSFAEQQLEQRLRLTPARVGTRAPADSIRARFSRNFQDMYFILIRMSDSLALSRDQLDQIDARRRIIRAKADSIYDGLAKHYASLPPDYDIKAAVKYQQAADSVIWQNNYNEQPFLSALLTKGQIRLLPRPMFELVTNPKYRGRFFGF